MSYPYIPILTGHLEGEGDSLVLEQARVRHHTGQWLPIHASARHQVKFWSDSCWAGVLEGTAGLCAFDLGVPGHTGSWAALRGARGRQCQALALLQGWARIQWRQGRHCGWGEGVCWKSRTVVVRRPLSVLRSCTLQSPFLILPIKVPDQWCNFKCLYIFLHY